MQTKINVSFKIIRESQPIPIKGNISNTEVENRGNYREQLLREYTTCENVVFYPVELLRKKK